MELIDVIDIHKSNDKNKRFQYNFLFVVNYKIEDYVLQKEEVAEVKYFTIEELKAEIESQKAIFELQQQEKKQNAKE